MCVTLKNSRNILCKCSWSRWDDIWKDLKLLLFDYQTQICDDLKLNCIVNLNIGYYNNQRNHYNLK